MRILFAGTPEMAVPTLERLAQRFTVCAVLTAPDRPAGRGRQPKPPPVKVRASELGIPILQPERLRAEARSSVATHQPTLLVCVAYGRIFGPKFLSLFPHGCINLHPSALPRFRGPAPIPATILAGDSELGITVQELALEMDSGDIYAQERVALAGTETTGELTELAARRGAELVAEVVEAIGEGRAEATPQHHDEATYCSLIRKEDGEIDFGRSAREIDRMVRAYNPWPGAYTSFGGRHLTIHRATVRSAAGRRGEDGAAFGDATSGDTISGDTSAAAAASPTAGAPPGAIIDIDKAHGILVQTGDGVLAVGRLQLQGKKPLDWQAFVNGHPEVKQAILGR